MNRSILVTLIVALAALSATTARAQRYVSPKDAWIRVSATGGPTFSSDETAGSALFTAEFLTLLTAYNLRPYVEVVRHWWKAQRPLIGSPELVEEDNSLWLGKAGLAQSWAVGRHSYWFWAGGIGASMEDSSSKSRFAAGGDVGVSQRHGEHWGTVVKASYNYLKVDENVTLDFTKPVKPQTQTSVHTWSLSVGVNVWF